MKLHFSILVSVLMLSACKARQGTANKAKEADDSAEAFSCTEEGLTRAMEELGRSEDELVYAQRIRYAPTKSGNCGLEKSHCQSSCDGNYWGITKLWHQKEFDLCYSQCFDKYSGCTKRESEDLASGKIKAYDNSAITKNRVALLERREELLKQIHLCTTDSATVAKLSSSLKQSATRDDEWKATYANWKSHDVSDPNVYASFRFISGTSVDTPARRGYPGYSEWAQLYESDKWYMRAGLAFGELVVTGLDTFFSSINSVVTLDIKKFEFSDLNGDSGLGAAPEQTVKIHRSCSNVKDVCTAISCLGHRTQEVLSVRENIVGVGSLAKMDDGREFAVCRHYAPTFLEACNSLVKARGAGSILKCSTEFSVSMMHIWPVIVIQDQGKTYKYFYDVLNDPMTPDLVPINDVAEGAAQVPCPAI